MDININVKGKFKINEKENNSFEEVPQDIREARKAFKKMMDPQAGSGHWINSAVIRSKITLSGTENEKIDAMPQDVRGPYGKGLRAVESKVPSSGVDIAEISGDMLRESDTSSTARLEKIRKATKGEPSFSPRTLIVSAVLLALIFLLCYLFQNG